MTYNPNVLQDLLRARSLSRGTLSARLGLEPRELEEELSRDPQPKQSLLNDIARELALPTFVFYMSKAPDAHDAIPDFRLAVPAVVSKSRETIEAIQLARTIQRVSADCEAGSAEALPFFAANVKIDEFALQAREYFGITLADQAESSAPSSI